MLRPLIVIAVALVLGGAAEAQTIDRIKDTGEIRLGYRLDAAPLSYVDGAGIPNGYTVRVCSELSQAIGRALKLDEINVKYVPVDTDNRFAKVVNGEIDLLCGAASITLSRREFVDFSIPIYVDGTAVMLPADAETSFSSLSGKKVGVRVSTTTEEALTNTLSQAASDAQIVHFDNHKDGLAAMKSGEIAAYFADQSILLFLNRGDKDFVVMDRLMTIEKQGLALQRGDTEFRYLVDGALSGMYAAGIMDTFLGEALPGVKPGQALRWLFTLAPELP
ncbi:MAG: amino acid ABC transporter substrate-binding protein [Marinibacterium sp.]